MIHAPWHKSPAYRSLLHPSHPHSCILHHTVEWPGCSLRSHTGTHCRYISPSPRIPPRLLRRCSHQSHCIYLSGRCILHWSIQSSANHRPWGCHSFPHRFHQHSRSIHHKNGANLYIDCHRITSHTNYILPHNPLHQSCHDNSGSRHIFGRDCNSDPQKYMSVLGSVWDSSLHRSHQDNGWNHHIFPRLRNSECHPHRCGQYKQEAVWHSQPHPSHLDSRGIHHIFLRLHSSGCHQHMYGQCSAVVEWGS